MGGHGALALALRNPDLYRSVSALRAGRRAVAGALGAEGVRRLPGRRRATPGPRYDACDLVRARPRPDTLLIDVGTADKFLDRELKPELFEAACADAGQKLELRRRAGYDHSYYFVATFVADHLAHHARGADDVSARAFSP